MVYINIDTLQRHWHFSLTLKTIYLLLPEIPLHHVNTLNDTLGSGRPQIEAVCQRFSEWKLETEAGSELRIEFGFEVRSWDDTVKGWKASVGNWVSFSHLFAHSHPSEAVFVVFEVLSEFRGVIVSSIGIRGACCSPYFISKMFLVTVWGNICGIKCYMCNSLESPPQFITSATICTLALHSFHLSQ